MANTPYPWPRTPRPRASWSKRIHERERRDERVRLGSALSASFACHLAVLLFFGTQLSKAYVLPEPELPPIPPVEAILVPPPPEPPPPVDRPVLRQLEPQPAPPQPQPQPPRPLPPKAVPAPPSVTARAAAPAPTQTTAPNPAFDAPVNPNPAPPRPVPPSPTAVAARPIPAPTATLAPNPSLQPPAPTPPAVATAPTPPALTPEKKKEEEERAAAEAPLAQPRQVAPSAPPAPIAPLNMAPVPRPPGATAAAPAGSANRPAGPGGANGDFTVKPSGGVEGGLRAALRASTVGCDNKTAVALNKTEQTACEERAGVRGANAPFIPVGAELNRDKRGALDSQAELVEKLRQWKAAAAPNGGDIDGPLGAPKPKLGDK